MPIAMVVVRDMAIQFHRDKSGLALPPPIRIFPRGDKAAQIQVRTKPKAAKANPFEKIFRTPLFSARAFTKKTCASHKLAHTKIVKRVSGRNTTNGRMDLGLSNTEQLWWHIRSHLSNVCASGRWAVEVFPIGFGGLAKPILKGPAKGRLIGKAYILRDFR